MRASEAARLKLAEADARGLIPPWSRVEIDALLAEIPMWRPIELAPKDGKEVLIWNSNGWEIASYHEAEEDAPDQPGHDAGWIGTYAHPGRSEKDEDFWEAQGQPTLWMPMPPVPDDDQF